jgi:hypothetical protein
MIINDNLKLATVNLTLAVNGSIGTAPTTVDIASKLTITASAASLIFTLPTPTDASSGDFLIVENRGATNSFTVGSTLIPIGSIAYFSWNGTAWKEDANVGRNQGASISVASITVGANAITHNLNLPTGSFSKVIFRAYNSTGNEVVFRRNKAADTANVLGINSTSALTNITFDIIPLA